jgi:hypothetical protein
MMTETERLAQAYGKGEATVEEVVAAAAGAKAAAKAGSDYTYTRGDYESLGRRMQTDDVAPLDKDGWDGIVAVYNLGGLTDAQFHELHTGYMDE